MSFNWFDVFVFGLTLLLALNGLMNGLFKEVFRLVGIIGGVFVASKYSAVAVKFIEHFYKIENASLASFAGFLVVLVVFWLCCLLIGNLLSKMLKLSGLGFVDKIGGVIFGGAKVFLILSILVFCVSRISFLNEKLENFAKSSISLNMLKNTGAYIMNEGSKYEQDSIRQNLEQALKGE